MTRVPVEFGGLSAQAADELVDIGMAIAADDCVLDNGTIIGRHGYRNALSGAIVGSGTPQGLFRHRASVTDYRTIAVVAGKVYAITDPSSDILLGTIGSGTTKFGATDAICAAQLNEDLYIGSDSLNSGVPYPLVRVKSSGTLEDVLQLQQGAKPTYQSISSMSFVRASTLTRTLSASVRSTTVTVGSSYAYYYDRNDTTGLQSGDTITVTLSGSTLDWTNMGYIVLCASPGYYGKMGTAPIQVSLIDNSSNATLIGEIFDTSVNGEGNTSPDVWVLSLDGVPVAQRAAMKYLKFEATGSQTMVLTGYYVVSRSPGTGDIEYRTTFYDGTTGQESQVTDTLTVSIAEPTQSSFPSTLLAQMNSDNGVVTSTANVDPNSLSRFHVGNNDIALPIPPRAVFAGAPTIRQAIPTSLQSAGTVRLWRNCSNGWRLVRSTTWITTTTTVDLVDDKGDTVLANQKWTATGTQSQCNAMASRNGRLILGLQNRLFISNWTPPGTVDLYPQFPPIAVEADDGWAFDLAPAKTEQILSLVNGDRLYIGTTEAVYSMDDVGPNSAVEFVTRRSCISRRGMIYAEDMCVWAQPDGVCAVQGRANAGTGEREIVNLTDPVRRIYREWLIPGSTLVLEYRERKLFVIVGTKFMRYDFVRRQWTRGTFAHTFLHGCRWLSPLTSTEQAWMLTSDRKVERLQESATTDDGTAIANWTYTTGYLRSTTKARLSRMLADVTGTVTLTFSKSSASETRALNFAAKADGTETELPAPADLGGFKWKVSMTGASTTRVRTLVAGFEETDGKGG